MIIFGMPVISFFAFLSWPVIFMTVAVIIYIFMSKQDSITDDSEFEKGGKHIQ